MKEKPPPKDRITKSRRLEKELSEKVDRNYEIQQRRDKERQSAQGFWKSLGQLGKELATISEWKTSDGELNRIRTEIFLLGRRDAEPEMERCVKDRLTAQNGVTELRGGMRVNLDQLAPIGFADASPSQALIDRLRQESEDAAFVHVNDGFDLLQFLPHFPIISTQVSDFQKVEDDMYAALENLRNAEARLGTAREEYKNYTDQKWLEKLHSMAERIGVVGREVLRHSSVSKESVNTVTAYSADRDNRPCKDEISSLDWALTEGKTGVPVKPASDAVVKAVRSVGRPIPTHFDHKIALSSSELRLENRRDLGAEVLGIEWHSRRLGCLGPRSVSARSFTVRLWRYWRRSLLTKSRENRERQEAPTYFSVRMYLTRSLI